MDGSGPDAPKSPPVEPEAAALDVNRLVATFRRRLGLFFAAALLAFAPVVLLTYTATPRYTATASVMLDLRRQNVVDVNEVLSGLPPESAVVDTEVEVLRSRSLAEKVAAKLNLSGDPEFNPALRKPGLADTLKASILKAAPGGPGAGARGASAETGEQRAQRAKDRIVDTLLRNLRVRRLGTTYVLQIDYDSPSAARAAQVANAFASQYMVEQLDAKFQATEQANGWLNERMDTLRQQVQVAEAAVQQYKIANNLMSAEGATLTEQEISTLNGQLAAARASEAEQQARLQIAREQLARGSNGGDVGEALSSPVVQQLRAQSSQQSSRVADLETRYGERHPELVKAKRSLADINTQIQEEIGRIVSNLEASAQVARQRTQSIEASVARSQGHLAGSNRATVGLGELQRNAEAVRTLYESFLNRSKQTTQQGGMEKADARIVSFARIPVTPSSPRPRLNLLLGLVLALGLGAAAILVAELFDSGLSVAEDVERELGLAYLGAIPALGTVLDQPKARGRRRAAPDDVIERPLSGFAESFRSLRASLLFSRIGEKVQVITVTSALPGEGKTTTCLCLARTLALGGTSVVVVDCDLRQRQASRFMAPEIQAGLLEVLNGTATLDEALVADPSSTAMVLPLTRSAHTPKEVFATPAMRSLLDQLRRRFDVVLLDTAPVLPVADARVLATLSDVVLLLVRWRKTPLKAVESALRLLKSADAFVAGAALTLVDQRAQARYGYGDPGYYYKSYRKYYGA